MHIRALTLGVDSGLGQDEDSPWGSELELTKWLKARFSEAPDWLLLKSLPVKGGVEPVSPYHLPGLNRRARKSLKRAKHIVLHVFSGRTKPIEFALGRDVAVVNLDVLYGGNVLDERVYAAAAALCGTGKVDAVIGGPPCCTNSILRERGSSSWPDGSDGGPRPVRGRSGLLRFGLPSNTEEEQRKVDEHTILIFRFVTLHRIADRFNPNGSLCALENPDDPMNYLPAHRKHDEIPSVWAWPELLGLLSPFDPVESLDRELQTQWYLARFDQGALGHVIRKPSAALTNSWYLYQELHELRGSGYGGALTTTSQDLGERIKTSGYWAKWAPGLCSAVGRAIGKWIESTKSQREEEHREGRMMLRALNQREREFRKHCAEGHIVFRRDCRACLEGQMQSHVHRRQKHHGSNTFCLTMDLVGPWKPGRDHLLGRPATRFLIASLTVPLPRGLERQDDPDQPVGDDALMRVMDLRGSAKKKREREREVAEYEIGADDDVDAEGEPGPAEMERRRQRGGEAWQREAEKLQAPVPTHDLIFVEPLVSKKSSEVLKGIQRVWVRIMGLGLTVRRLHTDGGREFCNKSLDAWALARDLRHTYSTPSDPKSNGRIENWVKHAKAGIRTLLCSDKAVSTDHWPSALRQWAEQRLRKSLKSLHVPDPIRPLPPFGAKVMVKNRQWSRKTPHDPKAMPGTVLCPAANIPNASVLLLESNQFYVAPVVYQDVLEHPSFEGTVAEDIPPAPPRRLTKKTSMTTCGRGESEGLEFSEGFGDDEGLGDDEGVRG